MAIMNQFAKQAIEKFKLEIGVHFTDWRDIPRIVYDQDTFDRLTAKLNERGLDSFVATYREMEAENDAINMKYATSYVYDYEADNYFHLYGEGAKVKQATMEIWSKNKRINPDGVHTGGCIYFHRTIEDMESKLNMESFNEVEKLAV